MIKLQIPAGAANPAPPVGPALGQHGVNIMEFCKAFNAQTQQDAGTIIPVEITVYRGPIVRLHHQDAAGGRPDQGGDRDREGLGRAEPREGRADQRRPGAPDRGAQDARPERQRPRRRIADHRRHRPIDGRRRRGDGGGLMHRGKRFRAAYEKVDRDHHYTPAEAVALVKETAGTKFDETVEVHLRLGVNVRHAEEQLRGTLALPQRPRQGGDGRGVRRGDAAKAATEAGADHVGAQDLADRVNDGWTDFDVAIATPDLMGPVVSKLGRILGPQGKMPNPKVGHGHQRRRQGRQRGEGRQGRVPHRPPGDRAPDDRQGELRRARAARELRRGRRRDRPRQARRRQGPLPALDHPGDDDGSGDPGGPVAHPRGRDPGGALGNGAGPEDEPADEPQAADEPEPEETAPAAEADPAGEPD